MPDKVVHFVCADHRITTPARVSGWTATRTLMDTATSLRLTAARITTSTAGVIPGSRRHTPTPRAPTSTEPISTDVVIIILARVTVIGFRDSAIIEDIIHTPVVVLQVDSITLVIAIITYSIERVYK